MISVTKGLPFKLEPLSFLIQYFCQFNNCVKNISGWQLGLQAQPHTSFPLDYKKQWPLTIRIAQLALVEEAGRQLEKQLEPCKRVPRLINALI